MKTDKAPPSLRNVEGKQLKSKSDEVNRVLYIVTENITPTSRLLKAAAKKLTFKSKPAIPQEPRWKKRIRDNINSMRKDLSLLDRWSKDELHNEGTKIQLGNRYKVKDKGLTVVTEELKQKIVATSSKLRKYEARAEQYVQRRMFQTNHLKNWKRGIEAKQENITITTDKLKKKKYKE